MDFERVLNEATPLLMEGLLTTVLISVLSILIGLLVGLLTCFATRSKNIILRGISKTYVWFIRGTPMMVQAFIVYLALPQVVQMFTEFTIDSFTAGLITLSLNAGAYMSEIFRGGIEAVPKGQIEAARSLGLSNARAMVKVVLPQAFKLSIPSLVNQFIITIKDSSLLQVIGLKDLLGKGSEYVSSTFEYFSTYIIVAVYYLVIISILMVVSKMLEKKLNYDKKS